MPQDYQIIGARMPAEIRVYRSAALSSGASGAAFSVPWDAESSDPAKIAFAHDNAIDPEQIEVQQTDRYTFTGAVKLGAGAWTEGRVAVEVDLDGGGFVAVYTASCGGSSGVLDAMGPASIPIAFQRDLTEGAIIRVRTTVVGTAGLALDVGELDTWLEIRGR